MVKELAYPVKLTQDGDTVLAGFPDFPEATTFGDDRAEALVRAVDCLATIIGAYMDDGQDVPEPSPARNLPTVTLPTLDAAKVHLYRTMREQGVGKTQLARLMGSHLRQVDRLLDLKHASRFDQVDSALAALGKRLAVTLREAS